MKRIIIIFILFTVPGLYAQDTLRLNLQKSIDIALQNNHDLKIARLEYEKAEEQVDEAFGRSVLPKINGSVDYRRAIKRGVIILETPFFSGSFPQGSENTLSIGATIEQPLFNGAVFYATRVAKVFAEISEKGYYLSKANLIRDVKRAYYSYLLAQKFLDLSVITLKSAEDNLKNTEALFRAGIAPEYDYVRAKVQVQNLLPEVRSAKNSIILAANSLKIVMGLDIDQPLVIKDSLLYNEIEVEDFNSLIPVMDSKNYTLQQLRLQIELQDKNVSYEFSKHFPELYFNGNWQTSAQENDPRPFNDWRYNNSVYLGLNLKIPIFNGWQTTSKVQQAKIDLKKVEEEYNKTTKLLKNQLDDILLKIDETKDKISAYQATIKEAQLGYDISQKRYANGLGTQLENIDALVALTRAQVNYYNAIFDYYNLHAQLEALLGNQGVVNNE